VPRVPLVRQVGRPVEDVRTKTAVDTDGGTAMLETTKGISSEFSERGRTKLTRGRFRKKGWSIGTTAQSSSSSDVRLKSSADNTESQPVG
jgi:hypothetical protein